jgi:hypothetical protein
MTLIIVPTDEELVRMKLFSGLLIFLGADVVSAQTRFSVQGVVTELSGDNVPLKNVE